MFKMTKDDLTKKSDAQLAALFQQVSRQVQPEQPDAPRAVSLLAMIRAELDKRVPRP